jgi:hypothetical protein
VTLTVKRFFDNREIARLWGYLDAARSLRPGEEHYTLTGCDRRGNPRDVWASVEHDPHGEIVTLMVQEDI